MGMFKSVGPSEALGDLPVLGGAHVAPAGLGG